MAPKHSERFLKIVDDARKRVHELTVDRVKAGLDQQHAEPVLEPRGTSP